MFRSDTRAVEVSVVATRGDGSLVKDLRKDEMRVFDNDREQAIASFEKRGGADTRVAAGPSGMPALRQPPRSIIVLDALNTLCGDQIYGREAVAQVLGKVAPGSERIAIFALGDKFHLLQDFSADTAVLREAVDDYKGERPFLGVDMDFPKAYPCDVFKEQPPPDDPAVFAVRQEQRLSNTLDALKTIARRMKTVSGEKSLLWVTAGFPPPASHQALENAMAELADAKVKLLAVDARGVPTARTAYVNVQTMEEMAEPTGGRAYYYNNDTAALVEAALDDSHEGYLLTFAPKKYREDGSLHVLRLKTSRKGVELRYRPSYVASPAGR
jgi:VWFA-related protein